MTNSNPHASSTLTVNLDAVAENYRILKRHCGDACKVTSVVKANAYGLGVEQVSKILAGQGCDEFFVANLDEALQLRAILANATIFVLHGLVQGQEETFTNFNITPVLNSIYQINLWQQHAVIKQNKLPCILHFDTGMNRLGLNLEAAKELARNNEITHKLNVKYIISHLACADEIHELNKQQFLEFQSVAENFKSIALSIANSAAIFLGKEYHCNMVRPGLALYGANPRNAATNPMKNVIKLTSQMLQIQQIDRAGTVGYGASHKIARGTKIATIAVGYADGYLRSLSDSGVCAIGDVIVPVIGRVSMDLVTLDVTKIPDEKLQIGGQVELIGDNIPVDIVAKKAGTIAYEILTSLGARYKRVYKTGG